MTYLERLEEELAEVETTLRVAEKARDLGWIAELRETRESIFVQVQAEAIADAKRNSPHTRIVDDVPGLYGQDLPDVIDVL